MANKHVWFTSSYSGSDGGNCVEVAVPWHKSSYSGGSGGNCVEVAEADNAVYVRDTKDRGGPALSVPGGQWSAFVTHIAARTR